MTYTRFCRALPLFCALALGGCGLTASPADGLNFKAPSGWQSSPGIMGFMQFWKAPDSNKEVLMLFKSPKPMDTKDVFSNAKLKDATVERQQAIKICGNQPAVFIKATANSAANGSHQQSQVQMVMSTAGQSTFIAMYMYPTNAAPNQEAASALRELCVVK